METCRWEKTPSYYNLILSSSQYINDNIASLRNYSFHIEALNDFITCVNNLSAFNYFIILVFTFFWTFARTFLTKNLFEPLADYCKLASSEREKFPESAWKFLFYLGTWSFTAYIILYKEGFQYLHQPSLIWEDYSLDMQVPWEVMAIYIVEISFYLNSLHSTLFLDQWRKDSTVLMAHHIVSLILFFFTLTNRSFRCGLIAIFLHDSCDILLEGTKSCVYFKKADNGTFDWFKLLADIGFSIFAVLWAVNRLYLFPLRNVYSSSIYLHQKNIRVPFSFFLNMLSYVLLIMNIYWFSFIVRLLCKVVSGGVKEIDDIREYDDNLTKEKREENVPENIEDKETSGLESYTTEYFLRQRKEINNGQTQ